MARLSWKTATTLDGGGTVDAYGGLSIWGDVAISATTLNNYDSATWDHRPLWAEPQQHHSLRRGNDQQSGGCDIRDRRCQLLWRRDHRRGQFACSVQQRRNIPLRGDRNRWRHDHPGPVHANEHRFDGRPGERPIIFERGEHDRRLDDCRRRGAIDIRRWGAVSGSLNGAAGSVINFYGPSYTLGASSNITCAGTVLIQDTAVIVDGTYDVSGSTQVYGGGSTLTFSAPIADLGADLNIIRRHGRNHGGSVVQSSPAWRSSTERSAESTSVNITVTGSMTWDLGNGDLGIGNADDRQRGDAEFGRHSRLH